MNLILSDDTDKSTTEVQFWLKYYKTNTIRLNGIDEFYIEKIEQNADIPTEIYLSVVNKAELIELPLHEVQKYYYRRGAFNLAYCRFINDTTIKNETINRLNRTLANEVNEISKYLSLYLTGKKSINSFNDNNINKLNVLSKAKEIGLHIPPTIVTNNKKSLETFSSSYAAIITKAIWNGDEFRIGEMVYGWPTLLFDFQHLENEIPESFPLTLFQANIPKKYELRIFYLHEVLYTSCIFSQRDPKTRVDFREYNRENPNRVVSYNLPDSIAGKIIELMKTLNLNSGSIDMIYGQDNKYYFLEVNPIGQFEQVSYPCNYYLEREIARYFGESNKF